MGLKLVETKASSKSAATKSKLPDEKKAKPKKNAAWQSQPKKETKNTKLVMVETKKITKPKKKASPSKK